MGQQREIQNHASLLVQLSTVQIPCTLNNRGTPDPVCTIQLMGNIYLISYKALSGTRRINSLIIPHASFSCTAIHCTMPRTQHTRHCRKRFVSRRELKVAAGRLGRAASPAAVGMPTRWPPSRWTCRSRGVASASSAPT